MVEIGVSLVPDAVRIGVPAANKKALLQQAGTIAATAWGLNADTVTAALLAREKLGSTAFGGGVAIPHAKVDGLDRVCGLVLRLAARVDLAAVDDLPVDLAFVLLSPPGAGAAHLKALAAVSRRLRDPQFVAKMRGAASPDALYALVTADEARDAA